MGARSQQDKRLTERGEPAGAFSQETEAGACGARPSAQEPLGGSSRVAAANQRPAPWWAGRPRAWPPSFLVAEPARGRGPCSASPARCQEFAETVRSTRRPWLRTGPAVSSRAPGPRRVWAAVHRSCRLGSHRAPPRGLGLRAPRWHLRPSPRVIAHRLPQQTGCPDLSPPEVQLPPPSRVAGATWIPLSVTGTRRCGGFRGGRPRETWRVSGAVQDFRVPAPGPRTPGPGENPRVRGQHLPGLTPGRRARGENTALFAAGRWFSRDAHAGRRAWS